MHNVQKNTRWFVWFVCGLITGTYIFSFLYSEQKNNAQNLQMLLKERNEIIIEKNKEIIKLYNYIILLEKKPVQPAPMWTGV